jgi:hypothetical protein
MCVAVTVGGSAAVGEWQWRVAARGVAVARWQWWRWMRWSSAVSLVVVSWDLSEY